MGLAQGYLYIVILGLAWEPRYRIIYDVNVMLVKAESEESEKTTGYY